MALYISMYVMVYCLCIDVVYGLLQFGIILVYPIMSFMMEQEERVYL